MTKGLKQHFLVIGALLIFALGNIIPHLAYHQLNHQVSHRSTIHGSGASNTGALIQNGGEDQKRSGTLIFDELAEEEDETDHQSHFVIADNAFQRFGFYLSGLSFSDKTEKAISSFGIIKNGLSSIYLSIRVLRL